MNMDMTSNVPEWLTPVAWAFVALTLVSAALIALDIYVRRHRHPTVSSELVWIASALYLGPLAISLYRRHGREESRKPGTSATRVPTAVAGLPGGSASALAHLIGVPLVLASGLTIAGIELWAMIIVIGVVAVALLSIHEHASTRTRHGGSVPVGAVIGIAALTVLAFDIGMVAWMLLLHFNAFMPPPSDGVFWFLMQLGVLAGLATGYPVVRWLNERRHRAASG